MTLDNDNSAAAGTGTETHAAARVALIVTENVVEALDIAEAIRMRAGADHTHVRSVEDALASLRDEEQSPLCLIFGKKMTEGPAASCIAIAAQRGIPVLLIVDSNPAEHPFVVLQRPFTGGTLDAALDQIGF